MNYYSNALVYFARPIGMAGPIKIGVSANPEERIKPLLSWSPFPLEVVVMVKGGMELEQRLHKCFADCHSHGEWFFPVKRLVEAVDRIAAGVPVEEAVDLSDQRGSIKAKKCRSADTQHRLSLCRKLYHANKRAEKATGQQHRIPRQADRILDLWRGYRWPKKLPSAEDIAYLEAVIANPVEHCPVFEIVPYRKRATA